MFHEYTNPVNGHTVSYSTIGAFLGTLLFGFFYFAARGVWVHALLSLLAALFTAGLSWFVYPFFAPSVMGNYYMEKGWIRSQHATRNGLIKAGNNFMYGTLSICALVIVGMSAVGLHKQNQTSGDIPAPHSKPRYCQHDLSKVK